MTENNTNNNNNTDNKPKVDEKNRVFYLRGNVKDDTVKAIHEGILRINAQDDEKHREDSKYVRQPIKVIIETWGGSIYEGNALAGAILTSVTPVHTYCYGRAMSMGFFLFAVGHKRFASPVATFMYHNAASSFGGQLQQIEEDLEQVKKVIAYLDRIILSVTNLSQAQLDSYKKQKENWYMFSDEAKQYGLVDEILPITRQVR